MHKKEKGERFLPKINYIRIAMYKYLVSLQRYAIYAIQQKFLSKKTLQLLSGQALKYAMERTLIHVSLKTLSKERSFVR